MERPPQPTTQEQKFERAKRTANNERDSQGTAHDEKTACLKAQRLAKDTEDKHAKTPGKRDE